MPELPDVEGFRRYWNRYAAGHRVESVTVLDPGSLRNTTPQGLGRALNGRTLGAAERHGKWLIGSTGGTELLLHFGMTGLLAFSGSGTQPHEHDRVELELDHGRLRYRAMRKLGGIWLHRGGNRAAVTGPLGPDALGLGEEDLRERLAGRRGGIKSALMNQEVIAGLGNLLSDEVLWRARIDPRAEVGALEREAISRLSAAIDRVLRESNRHRRVPALDGWLTAARRSEEPPCPRCGTELCRGAVAGRTARWCPRCQDR